MKSTNMDIWVVGISSQFFLRGSETETNFQKNKVVTGKTPFFAIGIFFVLVLIYDSFVWKWCVFNLSIF